MNGSRARGCAVALAAALVVVAGAGSARGAETDPALAALGPGAERISDGHYRVRLADGRVLFSHGPDPIEDPADHGTGFGTSDPQRAPVCATDYYQHVLYGRPSGASDRYGSVKGAIQAAVKRMNAVLNEESLESGNRSADFKVKCDGQGNIDVGSFTSSANDFSSVADSASAAGYNLGNVDYTIFYDSTYSGVCGTGNFWSDERLTASNFNNGGGDYAVTYNNCWDGRTPMHENGHNQGAVQAGAPYSTGSGAHCNEDIDVMCYSPDGGNQNQGGTWSRCTDKIHYDCGHDGYFDSGPEPGEWLDTHWNIGSSLNRFVQFGGAGNGDPIASFSMSCGGMTCQFTDSSTDDGGIASRSWTFGDGGTSTAQNPTHTYATAGTYLVTLTVTDAQSRSDSLSQSVTVPNSGDPDPATPTLENGVPVLDRNGPVGTWRYFKVLVGQGAPSLHVRLFADMCAFSACNPDLDLYVLLGQKPTTSLYACRSAGLRNEETCFVSGPTSGYWYVGVYTALSLPQVPLLDIHSKVFSITATL